MNVLSLFDGMSCGQIALERAGIKVDKYYRAEIDKYANIIAKKNYPDSIDLGDVQSIINIPDIDLLIGGSPCQGFSFAGKQLNFEDPRSKLFFEFVRILKSCKPKYFLLENVKMKKEYQDVISEQLGVEPIEINSALVSAQNRKRLYWTNIPGVTQPEDKNIILKDVLQSGVVDKDKSYCIDANYWKGGNLKSYFEKHRRQLVSQPLSCRENGRRLTPDGERRDDKNGVIVRGYEVRPDGKTCALTTVLKDNYIVEDYTIRKLTPVECERLQTVPYNYTRLGNQFYLLYNKEEIKQGKVKLCNAKLTAVKERQLLTSMENSVFYITKDSKDTELSSCLRENHTKKKYVNIAIERLEKKGGEREGCVIDITKIGSGIKTHCIQTRVEKELEAVGIKKGLTVRTNTDSYMKITLGENSLVMKKYIISILIKLIIELKIYTYVKIKASILFCIDSLKKSQGNLWRLELSNLKMENIVSVSNTQRYKMLGNGWTVDVIAHIFQGIKNN